MSELDPILLSIRAAKAANMAAIEALTALEGILVPAEAVEATQANTEADQPAGCRHEVAVEVETGAGKFLVCNCGETITL